MATEPIRIPQPLQDRIQKKGEALQRAKDDLDDLLALAIELLDVPAGYVLRDVTVGFEPELEDLSAYGEVEIPNKEA